MHKNVIVKIVFGLASYQKFVSALPRIHFQESRRVFARVCLTAELWRKKWAGVWNSSRTLNRSIFAPLIFAHQKRSAIIIVLPNLTRVSLPSFSLFSEHGRLRSHKLFSCREFSPRHVLCFKFFVRNGKTVVHAISDPWQAFHQFLRDYTVLRLCCRTKSKLQKQTCSKNGHNIFFLERTQSPNNLYWMAWSK